MPKFFQQDNSRKRKQPLNSQPEKSQRQVFRRLSKKDEKLELKEDIFLAQIAEYADLIEKTSSDFEVKGHCYYHAALLMYRLQLEILKTTDASIYTSDISPALQKAAEAYEQMQDQKTGKQYAQETRECIDTWEDEFIKATAKNQAQAGVDPILTPFQQSAEKKLAEKVNQCIDEAKENGVSEEKICDALFDAVKNILKTQHLNSDEKTAISALMSVPKTSEANANEMIRAQSSLF